MADDDLTDDVFEDLADVDPSIDAPLGVAAEPADAPEPPDLDRQEPPRDVADLTGHASAGQDDPAAASEGEEEGEELGPRYSDCYEFFEEFLRNAIERRVNHEGAGRGLRWDPDWRRHPEIVLRMQALWEAWE